MSFKLDLEEPESKPPIKLDEFEQKLKRKQKKKKEIDQIKQFNIRTAVPSQKDSEDQSQFNLEAWGNQLANNKAADLFVEDGIQLLGEGKSTKRLGWRWLVADLLLHMVIVVTDFQLLFGLFGDLPICLVAMLMLFDYHSKVATVSRQKIFLATKFTLILSFCCLLLRLIQHLSKDYYILIVLTLLMSCEIKLWKQNKVILFMTRQIQKKTGISQMDMSDDI